MDDISNKKFWEELIPYSPMMRHGEHTKQKKKTRGTQTER
jgi:hypothetical protein